MEQRDLFGEEHGRPSSDGEVESELRRLSTEWRRCLDGTVEEQSAVLKRIEEVTRPLAMHPIWWVLPACECEDCRRMAEEMSDE